MIKTLPSPNKEESQRPVMSFEINGVVYYCFWEHYNALSEAP